MLSKLRESLLWIWLQMNMSNVFFAKGQCNGILSIPMHSCTTLLPSPSNSDLVSSDFHLFGLHQWDNQKTAVLQWLWSERGNSHRAKNVVKKRNFHKAGLGALIERCNTTIVKKGGYMNGYLIHWVNFGMLSVLLLLNL